MLHFWGICIECKVRKYKANFDRGKVCNVSTTLEYPAEPPGYLSPWYNRTGWLGVKHQFTYLLTRLSYPWGGRPGLPNSPCGSLWT